MIEHRHIPCALLILRIHQVRRKAGIRQFLRQFLPGLAIDPDPSTRTCFHLIQRRSSDTATALDLVLDMDPLAEQVLGTVPAPLVETVLGIGQAPGTGSDAGAARVCGSDQAYGSSQAYYD